VTRILLSLYKNSKGKGHPMTCLCRHKGEAGVALQPIHKLALEGDGWSVSCACPLRLGKTQHPFHRRLCRPWGHSEWHRNLASIVFQSLDCLVHGKTLYYDLLATILEQYLLEFPSYAGNGGINKFIKCMATENNSCHSTPDKIRQKSVC
jgi:hypothetical protein